VKRVGNSHRLATPSKHRRAGFTLVEMLTVVAALIILLGLMVSLAWDVRRQSSERLTKDLLLKLDVLMGQYLARYKQLPHVTPLVEGIVAGGAATRPTTRAADDELPDEDTLVSSAELNNRDFVQALRGEAEVGASPGPFAPTVGGVYDELTLRDAWGTPIVFMPGMHPAIGMALGNQPFFLSAGPDRLFRTLEDNLYSYEQGASQVTDPPQP